MQQLKKKLNLNPLDKYGKKRVKRLIFSKGKWIGPVKKGCKSLEDPNFKCLGTSCMYAHSSKEFDHLYKSDPQFREDPCPKNNKCQQLSCRFYHNVSEKRENILKENILNLKKKESENIPKQIKITNKGVDITCLVPYFYKLNNDEVKKLSFAALECLNSFGKQPTEVLPKNKKWHQLSLNLIQTKSKQIQGYYEGFVARWSEVSIVNFRSTQFTYQRDSLSGKLSFCINTALVANFVSKDIIKRQCPSLKIRIKSLQKKWECFTNIIDAIVETGKSIRKLVLDISEFIGPTDISLIKQQFERIFHNLPNIKVIKLRLEFDFLKGRSYEKEIVDIIFECLEKYRKSISFGQTELELNIFGIVLKRKKKGIWFAAEYLQPRKLANQKAMVRRLKNSEIHTYFMDQFVRKYGLANYIREFYVDFSNLYGLAKSYSDRMAARNDYNREISAILQTLSSIINQFHPSWLDKANIQFHQFYFSFLNFPKRASSVYEFYYGFKLNSQNKPLLDFEQAMRFGQILKSRLFIKNKCGMFAGNLFSINYKSLKTIQYTRNNASEFINKLLDNLTIIRHFYYFPQDYLSIYQIFQKRKRIFDSNPKTGIGIRRIEIPLREGLSENRIQEAIAKILKDISSYRLNMKTTYTLTVSQMMLQDYNMIRKRLIAVLAAYKKVSSRNPSFNLREEILNDILSIQNITIKTEFSYKMRAIKYLNF